MTELIKQIVKVGNSAGVLLPREWLNGKARVELISRPLDIKKEILEILDEYLRDIKGIYLVGSYARGEQEKDSDVDILAVTNNTNKRIKKGKYEITLISEDNLDKTLKNNILPILPMIKEAKPMLNENLIEKYKNIKPNEKNTKFILDLAKSSRKICKKSIEISKMSNKNVSDNVMYSIILGLRTSYVIDSLNKNKIPTTNGLKSLIIKLAGSEEPYNSYLRLKNNQADKESISPQTAEKLNNYATDNL